MFKLLLKMIPVGWQMNLPLSVRRAFYQKEFFEFLDLCAALIRDEKAKTFQGAIRLIFQKKKEPSVFIDYLLEVEKELVDGLAIYDAFQLIETKYSAYENEFELFIINKTTEQTSEFPSFENRQHDWGDKELESKMCLLMFQILIRAAQEKASSCRISWRNCHEDLDIEECGFGFQAEGLEDFIMKAPGEVFMTCDNVDLKVFEIPGSLMQSMINVFLGLADLPYWVKEYQEGNFVLKAEECHFEVSLSYMPNEKYLNFSLRSFTLGQSESAVA